MKFSLAKLGCDYEEEMELDVLLEIADPRAEEAPAVCCPRRDRELLVPKDAYDQIKGGFVYKTDRWPAIPPLVKRKIASKSRRQSLFRPSLISYGGREGNRYLSYGE